MDILGPVIALAAWTMVMWLWMYATRLPALNAIKPDYDKIVRTPNATLEGVLEPKIQWIAHNYNHLHEAPTIFYAVAIALALLDAGNGLAATLGWAYVGLRVIHSLVQATINKIELRFFLFALSGLLQIALIVLAAVAFF
ncbi:MAPEG family protein [Aurantiacibacter sp. D1-12]|uniref:MAPEG family protein n=1 Tax=Aurantiacibacter sp. D1-12 TaxID=2993658 RepID=UPI00237C8BDE|nr:MAPEG family protein [Aurantiacibacter sp. D1-12]MDE1466490.1 MAPEG family protein [Aurantiacibacter sp. D1-12]